MENIYVCGPTVYAKAHIGNLKPILTFDIYIRANRALGKEINFIHNITDIDDKIIAKAKEKGTTENSIASMNEKFYLEMLKAYNIDLPDAMPRVTDNIEGIVSFIGELVKLGSAYEKNGNVYFDVTSDNKYGTLSNRKLNEMKFNEDTLDKNNPADFALWKNTKEGIQFDSPWGKGRPGWHTECAFFVDHLLKGTPVDIHGGGVDLLFPHHENESTQFRAKNGAAIAKTFFHSGLFNLNGKKMSKSTNNLMLADEFLDIYGADTLRYIILTTSLTAPVNLNDDNILSAKNQIKKLSGFNSDPVINDVSKEVISKFSKWEFANGMSLLASQIKLANTGDELAKTCVSTVLSILGFNFPKSEISDEDKILIDKWNKLRKNKEFTKADLLRDELVKKNLI